MRLEIEFTDEEVERFLIKKNFKTHTKIENGVEVMYVSNLIGDEMLLKDTFNKLMKKRLLEW